MATIVIITSSHVCHNPRVLKEADALCAAGHDVEVLGARLDPALSQRDAALMQSRGWTLTPVVNLHDRTAAGRWRQWRLRLRTKAGQTAFGRLGWANPWQLGYAAPELLRAARARRADLFIVHLEQALWVGARLLEEGRPVGVDMEDWYSADLPEKARRDRPLAWLRAMEARLLRRCVHCTCPSQAMSEALAAAYGCPPPAVVYNVFPWAEREGLDGQTRDRRERRVPSIYWFSQTIGPDRGLEDLFAALAWMPPVEVHLRGALIAGGQAWLAERLPGPLRSRVHVHDVLPNEQLLSRIAEHDVGFAGEVPYCRNKDLTASNKVFHYLLGGLAVVASATQGQREVLSQAPGAGFTYPPGDARSLAAVLSSLLEAPGRLRQARAAALEAARARFCWEIEAPALVQSVARATADTRAPAPVS